MKRKPSNGAVANIVFANRKYFILQIELARVGAGNPGRRALDLLDIDNPELNWTQMAAGMGVNAVRVTDQDQFNCAFKAAVASPGPHLIEAMI